MLARSRPIQTPIGCLPLRRHHHPPPVRSQHPTRSIATSHRFDIACRSSYRCKTAAIYVMLTMVISHASSFQPRVHLKRQSRKLLISQLGILTLHASINLRRRHSNNVGAVHEVSIPPQCCTWSSVVPDAESGPDVIDLSATDDAGSNARPLLRGTC